MPSRLLFLRPPDLPKSHDPDELAEYHRRNSKWQFRAFIAIGILVMAGAWALSPIGLARAGDVEAKIELIKEDFAQIKIIQARDSRRLASVLANGIASEMRALALKRCQITDSRERESINKEIGLKQEEYKEYKDENYTIPTCSEL